MGESVMAEHPGCSLIQHCAAEQAESEASIEIIPIIPPERRFSFEEIEITPKMIEAGVCELAQFNPYEDSYEAAVCQIFHAMFRLMR
jgi:hypothetical protein